jgi:hypothetical protein
MRDHGTHPDNLKKPGSSGAFLQTLMRYTHLRAEDLVGRLG